MCQFLHALMYIISDCFSRYCTSQRSSFSPPTLTMVMEENATYRPMPEQGIYTQCAIWKTLLISQVYFALILVVECQIVPHQIRAFSTTKLNPNNEENITSIHARMYACTHNHRSTSSSCCGHCNLSACIVSFD